MQQPPVIRLHEHRGIAWCAAWFGFVALAAFVTSVLPNAAFVARAVLLAIGGLHGFVAFGLLRGVKAAWHLAAFLAFITIVLRASAIACAPGEIADGDKHLLQAALDVAVLAIAIVIYGYLRKPHIRVLYGVPESYRLKPHQ